MAAKKKPAKWRDVQAASKPAKTPPKSKGGRPPKEINVNTLIALGRIQCTIEEAAAVLKVTKKTLITKLEDPALKQVWEDARAGGKRSLRRLQWSHAQQKGSSGVTMTIHLSKHWLGETEKSLIEHQGKGGGPILTFDAAALRDMTDDELAVLERALAKLDAARNAAPAT